MEPADTRYDRLFVRNMVESSLRIGLLFLLLVMTWDVVSPFSVPLIWGGIIAIAAFPLVKWLEPKLGGRRGLSSTLVTLVFVSLLVIPTYHLTESMVGGVKYVSSQLEQESLEVPPPPEKVKDLPLVGEKVYDAWSAANENLETFITEAAPQLKQAAATMLSTIGNGVVGVLMFVVSLLIAGGLMAYAESSGAAAHRFFVRLGGDEPGGEWATLCVATVRSVLQGVVGVAVIQALLCSIGLFLVGIPGAPIWSALILFLSVAQLPVIIVVLPTIIWAFSATSGTTATIYMVWMLLAGLSDNVLKPMLMGRGLDIPMPVILIGAIGGMLSSGIIGLFAGAVVLSIWYKLFQAWLEQESE